MPKISEQAERHGYSFCTPLRGNRYPTAKGDNQPLVGEESFDKQTATWLFRLRKDGSYNIENASNGLYISPDSPNNQAPTTRRSMASPRAISAGCSLPPGIISTRNRLPATIHFTMLRPLIPYCLTAVMKRQTIQTRIS